MAGDIGQDRRSLLMMAVAISLLTLMSAGVGITVGLLLQNQREVTAGEVSQPSATEVQTAKEQPSDAATHGSAPASSDEQTPEPAEDAEDIRLEDLRPVAFPPILTTLAKPIGTWIRLEGALLVVPDSEKDDDRLAVETGEQILTYLRTLRLEDIETPSGFLGLRDDLNETVKIMSGGQIHGVLIHGLVVE